MSIKTSAFNPFDFMDSDEEIHAFLVECFQDEDPQIFVNALGHLVRKKGMTQVAKITGLSRESLYKTFNGQTQPKWDTIHRIMTGLKINLMVAA